MRGGTHEGPQASNGHRVCYVIPDGAEADASDVVITVMVLLCHRSA